MVISSKIIGIIAVIIIAVAAITAWQVYPTLNKPTNNPTPTPNPTATAPPTPTPTATAKPTPKPTSTHSSSSSSSSSTTSPTATPTPTPDPVVWNLNFSGGNSINMTNLAFENLASTQGVTYTQNDTNSNTTWTGIPLYKLVNYYVDTGNISYGVLSLGYNVTVIASDTYNQTFTSARVMDNQNIIVANTGNGTTFTDPRYYPLTLAGSNLTKRECVKLVSQIRIDTLLPVNMTLTVKAHNGTTVTFNRNQIAGLPTINGMGGRNTHGNITGVGNYTGISVQYLANLVGGLPNATYSINVVAADGYVVPISYSKVVLGTGFSMFNQTTNAAQNATQPITPMLAFACNNALLPMNFFDNGTVNTTGANEGPFRLMFIGPEGLLMGSSPSVRWAVEVDVVSA